MSDLTPAVDDVSDEWFIDRKAEQELFTRLLKHEDDARLLAINDRGGRGKSQLLARLEYVCQFSAATEIPVSLTRLDQMAGNDSRPVVLAEKIRKDFARFGLGFDEFDELNDARVSRKHETFGSVPTAMYGAANLLGAKIEAGGIAGGIVAIGDTVSVGQREWTGDMERRASNRCLTAFINDLRALARDRTMVILLDAVDSKADRDLVLWVAGDFARQCSFNLADRPQRLILVLAGREPMWFMRAEKMAPFVKSIRSLSEWEKEHVKRFLAINGCANADDTLVSLITSQLAGNASLLDALNFAKVYLKLGMEGIAKRLAASGDG